jgi:hypothetical protein
LYFEPGVSGRLRNSLVGDSTAKFRLILRGVPLRLEVPLGGDLGSRETRPLRFWMLRGSMDLRRRWPPRGMRAVSIAYGDSGSQVWWRSQLKGIVSIASQIKGMG